MACNRKGLGSLIVLCGYEQHIHTKEFMKKPWKATFIITLEGANETSMTAQVARDKLLAPCQEMWILRNINRFSIEEVEPMHIKTKLTHEDEAGERESFYKTGFPKQKKGGEKK